MQNLIKYSDFKLEKNKKNAPSFWTARCWWAGSYESHDLSSFSAVTARIAGSTIWYHLFFNLSITRSHQRKYSFKKSASDTTVVVLRRWPRWRSVIQIYSKLTRLSISSEFVLIYFVITSQWIANSAFPSKKSALDPTVVVLGLREESLPGGDATPNGCK